MALLPPPWICYMKLCLICSTLYFYRRHPKDWGRYCFQFVSPHRGGGGGCTPCLGLNSLFQSVHTLGGGGYPIQPWMGGGDLIQPWTGGGYLIQPWTGGGYPIQPWTGGGTPTLDGGGYPIPCPGGYTGVYGGRCASCVHAGGLSCQFVH